MRNSNPAADLDEVGLEKKSLHSFSNIRYDEWLPKVAF